MYHETIFIDAESLCIYVIGNGKITADVLTHIRLQALPLLSLRKHARVNAYSDQIDFVFLIVDGLLINKLDVSVLTGYLEDIKPHLILCLSDDIGNDRMESHPHNKMVSCIPVDGYIYVLSGGEGINIVNAVYQTVLEITGAIYSHQGINIDIRELCNTLTGPLRAGPSRIWACTSEATNPKRAVKAITISMGRTEFVERLNQTDGLVIKITGGAINVMGREINEIMTELNLRIPDRCKCVCSISHDGTLPKDGIKITLLAARWA